jgi:hypothetical protein
MERLGTDTVLYEDGGWELIQADPALTLKYWLSHQCDGLSMSINRFWDNLDGKCHWCGSVAPDGLQGMYLMLVML